MGACLSALALQLSPLGLGAAIAGSILPDVIDQKRAALGASPQARQRIFNRTHRGASHWFGWWLALFILCSTIRQTPLRELCAGLALGGVSHVILDMLTSRGVPLTPFSHRGNITLKFCATGSPMEYAVLGLFTIMILALLTWRYGESFGFALKL